jgi:predicted HTH domain antitoxin
MGNLNALQQAELLPLEVVDDLASPDPRNPEFSGDYIFRKHPRIYTAVVHLHAGGSSLSYISKLLSISRNTVAQILKREGVTVEQYKKDIAGEMRELTGLTLERIGEALRDDVRMLKTPLRDLSIVAGVLVDKSQLLDGSPTEIHQAHKPADVGAAAWDDYISNLRSANTDCMDLSAVAIPQKGADLAVAKASGSAVAIDCHSSVGRLQVDDGQLSEDSQ